MTLQSGRPTLGIAESLTVTFATYDVWAHRIVVELSNGFAIAFKAHQVLGMEKAQVDQLSEILISPSGLALFFPALDADLYIPALIKGLLGNSDKWVASVVARKKVERLKIAAPPISKKRVRRRGASPGRNGEAEAAPPALGI